MTSDSYDIVVYMGKNLPEQYRNMILSKWMRSLKYENDFFRLADSASFFEYYNRYIDHILNKPGTEVRLAALSDNRDVVLGWSISRGEILDYVHVRRDMRKQGIGSDLVPKTITTITHLTRPALLIWQSKYPGFIFNPFA